MEITIPKPGHSRVAERTSDDDIDDAWDQYDEEQEEEEEESAPDFDRKSESMNDFYRDLGEEFGMDPDAPSPAPASDSFGDFVAKETAKAKADQAAPPPLEPEEPLPKEESEPEAAAGVESAAPDPAEMIAEAVRAARAADEAETLGGKKRKYTKREDIQYTKPLSPDFKYSKILAHFRDDPRRSWPEVAILSEIDVFMIDTKQPCYAGREHYAPLARVGSPTAGNILSVLTRNGIITELGYHPGLPTKDRVVSPEYSSDPELSRNIINKYRK